MFGFPISVPLLPSPLQTLILLTWSHWCLLPPGWRYIYADNLNVLLQLKRKIPCHKPLMSRPSGFSVSQCLQSSKLSTSLGYYSLLMFDLPVLQWPRRCICCSLSHLACFDKDPTKASVTHLTYWWKYFRSGSRGNPKGLNEYFNGPKIALGDR